MPDHFLESRLGLFTGQLAPAIHGDGRYAAGYNDALDPRTLCSLQQISCAAHIGVVNFLRIGCGKTVVGRNMKNPVYAVNGVFKGLRIAQVALDLFDRQALNRPQAALRPNKNAHTLATLHKHLCHVAADKAGCSCNQGRHAGYPFAKTALGLLWPFLGLVSCHFSSFPVSGKVRLAPSTAEGSKPTCTMQCSHLGSFPGPKFSHRVFSINSLKVA